MKRKALALLLSLLLVLSLCGCGGSVPADAAVNYSDGAPAAMEAAQSDQSGGLAETAPRATGSPQSGGEAPSITDKIIYSAYAEIETRDFDASVEGVYALIDRFGGFLESSSVTGSNYYSARSARGAGFIIRIPSARFQELTESLTELGNVPYSRTNAENITAAYNDTSSRLEACEIEYDRLLAMLERAETVEEMLSIESRLSEVRYSIESLSNTLSGWDSLVNYSTVELQLTEVLEYTEEPVEEEGYWEGVASAFSATLKAVGRFFKGFFKLLVALSPVLAILAALAFAAVLIIRRARSRRKSRTPSGPPAPQPEFPRDADDKS